MGKTFWGLVGAAVVQSRREANLVAQGDEKFGPRIPQNKKKANHGVRKVKNTIKQTKRLRRPGL